MYRSQRIHTAAFLLIFLSSLAVFVKAGPCDDLVINGNHYALTTLANGGPYSVSVTGADGTQHVYQFAVCGGLPQPCTHQGGGTTQNCNGVGLAGMCETWPGNGEACGGKWEGSIALQEFNSTDGNGISFMYSNGDDCPCNPPNRRTTIRIICDATVTGAPTGLVGNIPDPANLMYVITMRHASGCNGSIGKGGLSGGSILLIIIVVVFSIYLFGGMAFNKFKLGKEGAEVVPNVDFWSDLPALVKDGARFIFSCGQSGGYQTV